MDNLVVGRLIPFRSIIPSLRYGDLVPDLRVILECWLCMLTVVAEPLSWMER